jgi:hypothetical protein
VECIDLAHSYGKYLFTHSDGYDLDVLPGARPDNVLAVFEAWDSVR